MLQTNLPGVRATSPKRALLDEINAKNQAIGLRAAFLTAGYLRSEVQLSTNSEIVFPIGVNENAPGQTVQGAENRLAINDAFYITHMSVMFYDYATDAADIAVARGQAILQTFANTNVFGANAPAVEAAYNGRLSIQVDETVWMLGLDALRFKRVTQAQQALGITTTPTAYDQSGFEQWTAYAQESDPVIRLNGSSRNRVVLTLPSSNAFTGVTDHAVVAALLLGGWYGQNAGASRSTNINW